MPKIMKNILLSLTTLFSPFAAASNWVQVNDWATPLKVNPNSLEQKLWSFVATESKVKFQPKDTYTFQYKTINDSNLSDANLNGAKLKEANIKNVNLKNTDLRGAEYDESTLFPEGFDPKKRGMVTY